MKLGNIPKILTFFIRPPTKVYWRWEDVEGGDIEHTVLPCYISDAENKNTLNTGKNWAEESYYDYEAKSRKKAISQEFTIENKPFKNLRIITLEIRDKGGRAYKVCADIGEFKNLFFDARECIILDSIFEIGISVGGIIEGDFIFAKVGAQMMPVRVGSFLHEKMIEATKHDELKPITDLEIGGVYKNKRGDECTYLGQYWAREPKIELTEQRGWGGYNKEIQKIILSKPSLVHVFHSCWDDKDYWFRSKDEHGYKKGEPTAYTLTMVKKHSFKEKIKTRKVPENYVEAVKNKVINTYSEPKHLQHYPHMSERGLFGEYSKLLSLSLDKNYIHPMLEKFTHE